MSHELFILEYCPDCLDLFKRIEREFGFLLSEFGGRVKYCNADKYGCDISIDVDGILIRFETSPRDGIEFGYHIILPVPDDPANKLNTPHIVGTILDFIEDAPPPKYGGPGWGDDRGYTPEEFRKVLPKIVEFHRSPQFNEKKDQFNKWHDEYFRKFRKSVDEYYLQGQG